MENIVEAYNSSKEKNTKTKIAGADKSSKNRNQQKEQYLNLKVSRHYQKSGLLLERTGLKRFQENRKQF